MLKFKARLTARDDLVDPKYINRDQLNASAVYSETFRWSPGRTLTPSATTSSPTS
jgi:hypothetical protein